MAEVEWQFDAVDLEAVGELLGSGEVAGCAIRERTARQISDTYIDTASWRIHRSGHTARIRSGDGEDVFTLKTMSRPKRGIRSREEFEERAPSGGLSQLADLPGDCGRILRLIGGGEGYRELFKIQTHRRRFQVLDGSSELAEVALDRTECFEPGSRMPGMRLLRVEVEAAAGADIDRVRSFSRTFAELASLGDAARSKFEAGLITAGLEPSLPNLGADTVSGEMTAGQAGLAVIRRQFLELCASEPGTRLGASAEPLHDMRVAIRRLRVAFSAFEDYLGPAIQAREKDAKWLGGILSHVRDLDVQLEIFEGSRAGAESELGAALLALSRVLEEERARARRRMIRALSSSRFTRFVDDFSNALQEGPDGGVDDVPVLQVGPGLMEKRYRALRVLGDAITLDSVPAEYHRVRIAAKELRYGLEFLAAVYGSPAKNFRTEVKALQDLLGRHQDLDVTAETLRGLVPDGRLGFTPEAVAAVTSLGEDHAREAAALRRQFPAVYRRLNEPVWQQVLDACDDLGG